jgi:hypothetical protein
VGSLISDDMFSEQGFTYGRTDRSRQTLILLGLVWTDMLIRTEYADYARNG